jgi:hypothetical protein
MCAQLSLACFHVRMRAKSNVPAGVLEKHASARRDKQATRQSVADAAAIDYLVALLSGCQLGCLPCGRA